MNWKQATIAIIIIAGAGAAAFFWYWYGGLNATEPVVRSSSEAGSRELLDLLGSLEGLRFDVSFFDDPAYKSLQDFSPAIQEPESRGSENPFVAPAR